MLDRFPTQGETVTTNDNVSLTAKKVNKNRIETVTILLPLKNDNIEKDYSEQKEATVE